MIRRFADRKMTVLIFVVMLLGYGIVGASDAHDVSGVPHFHDDSTTRSVAENVSVGTNVGSTVSAHSRGTYGRYVLGGTDASSFTINESSGQLKTGVTLDYETKASHSVTVTVQRGTINPLSDAVTGPIIEYSDVDSITVTINVTDVNLSFSEGDSTTRSIAENTSSNTNIGSAVTASNFDSNLDRYALSGTDASSFKIDTSTGQLKTEASLDYESKKSYTVTVEVYAGKQATAEDTITVTITVTNSTDTYCPEDYTLYNNDCLPTVYGVGFGEADALPSFSSEEAARIVSLLTMDRVICNELFNASNDTGDWIEFRNVAATDVDLSGWRLIVATDEATTRFNIPEGIILPPGDVLLFLNTDPSHPDMPLTSSEDASYNYLVNSEFILPQTAFTLMLRSPDAWEDVAGNYFFGYEDPPSVPSFTADMAWLRAKPSVPGSRAEAWVSSGYQDGLGYDDGTSEDIGLGTPGYHQQQMLADANGDGVVNILDLVIVASHIGESDVPGADLNNDGVVNIQDLVLVANGLGAVAAAPPARELTAAHVDQWLKLARQEISPRIQSSVPQRDFSYERGIQVLEQLRQSLIPKTTTLLPNYPNPFNPETWIPYHLANPSDVQITIYDARGTVVRQLDLGHQREGYYTSRSRAAYWDGTNEIGESVASGLYFYQLQADNTSTLRKMLILK